MYQSIHNRKSYLAQLFLGFVLTFGLIPFYIDIRVHENAGINIQRIFVSIIFLLTILIIISQHSSHRRIHATYKQNKTIAKLAVIFVMLRIAAAIKNPASYGYMILANELMMNLFIMFFCSTFFTTKKQISTCASLILFSAIIVSLFSIFENIIQQNPLTSLANTNTTAGEIASQIKFRDGNYRSQGTFEHPLSLAQFILISAPLLFTWTVSKKLTPIALAALAVLLIASYLTYSRTIYVGLLAATLVILHINLKNKKSGLASKSTRRLISFSQALFTVGSALTALAVVYMLVTGGSDAQQSSSATRLFQLYNGWIGIQQDPALGHGLGTSQSVITGIGQSIAGSETIWNETIDNYMLGVALDSGIPSLAALISILVLALKKALEIATSPRSSNRARVLSTALTASLLAGFISMFVLSIFTILPMIFTIVGLICALSRIEALEHEQKKYLHNHTELEQRT